MNRRGVLDARKKHRRRRERIIRVSYFLICSLSSTCYMIDMDEFECIITLVPVSIVTGPRKTTLMAGGIKFSLSIWMNRAVS